MNEVFYITAYPPDPELVSDPRTLETLRRSLDGTLCIVGWEAGQQPGGVEVMGVEEARALMATEAWSEPWE